MRIKTFAHLRKAVAAYMNRDESAFVSNGFDVLTQACNDAHQWVQRKHIFDRASVFITVPSVSLTDGAQLSTAVLRGTSTAVIVRALKAAWLPSSGGGELPIRIVSREEWVARRQRRNDFVVDVRDEPSTLQEGGTLPLEVVLYGEMIHLTTADPSVYGQASTVDLHFDAIRWYEDYENADDTDFCLTYFFDFMVMRSIYYLNFYLKEDQRVPISAAAMNDTWESVIAWDTSLRTNSIPLTCD